EAVINHSPDFSRFDEHIYGDGKAGEKIVDILLEDKR
ncbi:MAG: hypothetical protein PWQ72_1971, partial [Pseudothermotoga sp.]|nr:hypothetical protein [Pseudothermotoga sp.]